ncbi:MAG: hypothetical protein C0447_12390 [Methylobacterium sp.]|nr:hypothetical protein [Methylobacterium sp.]
MFRRRRPSRWRSRRRAGRACRTDPRLRRPRADSRRLPGCSRWPAEWCRRPLRCGRRGPKRDPRPVR